MNRLALIFSPQMFSCIMLIFLLGCERNYDVEFVVRPTETTSMQIMLAPSSYEDISSYQNLEVVIEVLRIDLYGEEHIFDPPVTKNFSLKAGHSHIAKLKVPMGDGRVIDIKGYEFGELVMAGRQVVDYVGDEVVVANITLDPVGMPLLSIDSPQTSYKVGDEMILHIRLKNVTDLFGIALELEYNRSRFFPLGVESHSDTKFAKSGLPVFHDLNLDSQAGQMQIALTLTRGQKPITIGHEGQIVAVAKFRAVKAGTSEIRVKALTGTSPLLTQSNGKPLDDLEGMRQYLNPSDGRSPRGVIRFLIK